MDGYEGGDTPGDACGAARNMRRLGALLLLCALCTSTASAQPVELGWKPARTWVFAVGILEWRAPAYGPFPKKNRRDARLVRLFAKRGVPAEQIVFLQDESATLTKIRAAWKAFLPRAKKGDLLVFYFAGHGDKARTGTTYFVPHDAEPKKLTTTGWSVASILDDLDRSFGGGRVLLTADCCYSGALARRVTGRRSRLAYAALTSSLASASSTGNWTFTEGLLAGLRGRAWVDADGDRVVTLAEIATNVRKDMSFAEGQLSSFATTKGFAAVTALARARARAGARLGERLEAKDQGRWWRARVIAVRKGEVKIHFFGWDDSYDEWLPADSERLRPYRPRTFAVGTWIRAEWKKDWYAGQILAVVDGVHHVHYTGFEKIWDEWVAPERLRPLALKAGAKVLVKYLADGSWYAARVLRTKDGEAEVDYDDYDDSWNEWAGLERIKLR